jgi:deoxyribonuclease-2
MGSCFSCSCIRGQTKESSFQTAIKSPHGVTYKYYDPHTNIMRDGVDINDWIDRQYQGKRWTHFIVYNDQTEKLGLNKTTHGHTKGILCWNESSISWLVHSVPNFPREFKPKDSAAGGGMTISLIEHGEHIFGQSFVHIECKITELFSVSDILAQLHTMEPNVFIASADYTPVKHTRKHGKGHGHGHEDATTCVSKCELTQTVTHVAKPPLLHLDIYEDYLVHEFDGPCLVESWMRGQSMDETNMVTHVKEMNGFSNIIYTETHDHSKIAVSTNVEHPWVYIGDLNRMHSQKTRGGGGIVIRDLNLWLAYRNLIVS